MAIRYYPIFLTFGKQKNKRGNERMDHFGEKMFFNYPNGVKK